VRGMVQKQIEFSKGSVWKQAGKTGRGLRGKKEKNLMNEKSLISLRGTMGGRVDLECLCGEKEKKKTGLCCKVRKFSRAAPEKADHGQVPVGNYSLSGGGAKGEPRQPGPKARNAQLDVSE